jgi:Mce-associated membrane protein
MAKLKRDERVCPFCGENIKAVAIRCRFCQSDVIPLVEPEAQPETKVEPKAKTTTKAPAKTTTKAPAKTATKAPAKTATKAPAKTATKATAATEAAPAVEESAESTSRAVPSLQGVWILVKSHLTIVLAVLVLLAGAGVGALWWNADHGSETVAAGALVGEDARNEVLVSAADLTQRTLSYDYKSLANDMEVARARMTPTFRKQYDATMAQVKANTIKNKIVLQADAVSSAIIDATEHKARVLVFVNQTTTAGVGKKANQQLIRNSLVITLTRGGGDWAMSKLTALG